MKFGDLVERLQKLAAKTKPAASAAPRDPDREAREAVEALDELDRNRADAQERLEAARSRRRELLVSDVPAEEVIKADIGIERLEVELERLDALEPMLIEVANRARLDAKNAMLAAFVEDYKRLLGAFYHAQAAAAKVRFQMIDVREKARAAGFEGKIQYFGLPLPNANRNWWHMGDLEAFWELSIQELNAISPVKAEEQVYPVIVRRRVQGAPVNPGMTIGLSAREAHAWVKAGAAEWADRKNIPPVPAELEAAR